MSINPISLKPSPDAAQHYENFPVGSLLLPAKLRPAVHAIYQFARSADDIADEGDATPAQRLSALQAYSAALTRIEQGLPAESPLFATLSQVVQAYALPCQPMHDLLSAFAQDVTTLRYPDYVTLLDYCRRSANPVGRLMLHLYGAAHPANLRDSDAICTALQLINFWQDVAIDIQKARIYIPQQDLVAYQINEADLLAGRFGANWTALMAFECQRARQLMLSGAPLCRRLPGRIGWELRLVVQGGLRILEKLEQVDYDVATRRPVLRWPDWMVMLWRALRME